MIGKAGVFLAAMVTLSVLLAGSSEAAPRYDRTCGLLPGQGGFSFVRAKNTTCPRARRVTRKALKKFCRSHGRCAMYSDTDFYRGKVRWNGWRCKAAEGWEYIRVKCRRGGMRVIWMAAA